MFCTVCGNNCRPEARYCPACGALLADELDIYARRLQDGDINAFREIYDSTTGWVKKEVREKGILPAEIEDCMQEFYLHVYDKIRSYDPEKGRFRPWFNVVLKNKIEDYSRKHRKRWQDEISLYAQENGDDSYLEKLDQIESTDYISPEKFMDQEDMKKTVWLLLDGLPDLQKNCLILRYQNQLKQKEIAERLKVSIGTVKSSIAYGMKSVEKKAKKMEKSGLSLYGLAPAVFFIYLLSKTDFSEGAEEAVWHEISQQFAVSQETKVLHRTDTEVHDEPGLSADVGDDPTAAVQAVDTVTQMENGTDPTVELSSGIPDKSMVSTGAAARVSGGGFSGGVGKVLAGAIVAAIVVGVGYGIYHYISEQPAVQEEEPAGSHDDGNAGGDGSVELTSVSEENMEWRNAYAEYFSSPGNKSFENQDFYLLYINDDDIPEIYQDSESAGDGARLFYLENGYVKSVSLSASVPVYYIEKGGYFVTSYNQSDTCVEQYYQFEGDTLNLAAEGMIYYITPLLDGNEDISGFECEYQWDGDTVTEEEYAENVAATLPVTYQSSQAEVARTDGIYYYPCMGLLDTTAMTDMGDPVAGTRQEMIGYLMEDQESGTGSWKRQYSYAVEALDPELAETLDFYLIDVNSDGTGELLILGDNVDPCLYFFQNGQACPFILGSNDFSFNSGNGVFFSGTAAGTTVRNMYQWDGNTVTIYTVSDSPFEQELSADDSFSVQAKEIGISKEEYVQLLSEGQGSGLVNVEVDLEPLSFDGILQELQE